MGDAPAVGFFELPRVLRDRFGIVVRDRDLWQHAVRRTRGRVSAYTAGQLLELVSERLRRQPMPERAAPLGRVYQNFRDVLVEAYACRAARCVRRRGSKCWCRGQAAGAGGGSYSVA